MDRVYATQGMKPTSKHSTLASRRMSSGCSADKQTLLKPSKRCRFSVQEFLKTKRELLLNLSGQWDLPEPPRGQCNTLIETQLWFLKGLGIDPQIDLPELGNSLADKQPSTPLHDSSAVKTGPAVSGESPDTTASQVVEVRETLLEVQKLATKLQEQQTSALQHCQELTDQLAERTQQLAALRQAQDHCGAPGQAESANTDSSFPPPHRLQLRVTHLPEKRGEDSAELLQAVTDLLATLPRVVEPVAASRCGVSSNREGAARPVHVTLATIADIEDVLRCKAALSKDPETSKISINEVLTREEQAHKQALWGLYVAAKQQRRRATFRRCDLYIDGNLVMPPSGPVSGLASSPLAPFPNPPLQMQPMQIARGPTCSTPQQPWQQQQQQPQHHSQPAQSWYSNTFQYPTAQISQILQSHPVPAQPYPANNLQQVPAPAPAPPTPQLQPQQAQPYPPIVLQQPPFNSHMPQPQNQSYPHPPPPPFPHPPQHPSPPQCTTARVQ